MAVLAGLAATVAWRVWTWVSRWGAKTHDGFATDATLRRTLSARAARAKRAQTRPDLAGRRRAADTEFGYRLGRAVTAGHRQLLASWESSMLVIGPPGCGKTFRLLVPALLDHPGPAIVTSTKVDIYEATAKARQARGRPVWVLDPEDMAPAGGQVRWSVVRGCEDTRTAERRAAALVAGAPGGQTVDTGNSAFFKTSALSVLKAFLHAAALGDKTIVDVTRWCRGDHAEAQAILAGQADVMVDPARMLTQHTIGAPETTSGVMRYVENTLACFAHRQVIDLCTPSPDDDFDMHRFVSEGGTVYLLGRGEKVSSASALTTAFCEELLYVAGDVIAPTRPGRRLTPPLLACLDEAPSVAPIPTLPLQLADARGRGIVVILSAQSPSQLRTKWSDDETDTMFNASNIQTVFGGLSVDRDLRWMSELAGQRFVMDHTRQSGPDWRSQFSTRWDQTPVLRPDEIRTLRPGHALVMAAANPPVISDLPLIFDTRGGRQVAAAMAETATASDQARAARATVADDRPGPDEHPRARRGAPEPARPGGAAADATGVDRAGPGHAPGRVDRRPRLPAGRGVAVGLDRHRRPPSPADVDPLARPGGVSQPALRLGSHPADPALLGVSRRTGGGAHHLVLVPVGGVQRAGRQRRPGPELAHLSPARLLPAHEHVVRGAAQPDPMPERPAPAAPPAHQPPTGWRSGARPPPMWPNWTRICGRSRPSDTPIWPPSPPRLHPAIRAATATRARATTSSTTGEEQTQGGAMASLEKLRTDRETDAREQLDSWADELRTQTGLAERDRRRSPRERREGLCDRPAGLRVALHHRASDPDPDPVLTRPGSGGQQ